MTMSPVDLPWPRALLSLVVLAITAATTLAATPADAAWTTAGAGAAAGAATTMPTGTAPSGRAGTGSVTLAWTAAETASGAHVDGYVIRRYDATNGTLTAVNGTCAGVVTATTCTDQPVPAGTWVYTDTPVLNNWTGGESAPSPAIAVSV